MRLLQGAGTMRGAIERAALVQSITAIEAEAVKGIYLDDGILVDNFVSGIGPQSVYRNRAASSGVGIRQVVRFPNQSKR